MSEDGSPVREVVLDAACPVCGAPNLTMRSLAIDLPYFGDALQTTVLCGHCGFRHADILHMKEGEPTRHELRVEGPADLSARVVRSTSGTIRIPELGATIEPGPSSDAFVSNAEGVLHRVRDIVGILARGADTASQTRRAAATLETLERMIAGRAPFTLVLEDPFGNSAILHDRALVRRLTNREVRGLKTGTFTVDLRGPSRRAAASR